MPLFNEVDDQYLKTRELYKHWHRNDFLTHLVHEATGGPQQGVSGDSLLAQGLWQRNATNNQIQRTVDQVRIGTSKIQGIRVANTIPTNGQTLVYNAAEQQYVPGSPSSSSKAFIGGTIGTTITPGTPANPVYIPLTGGTFSFVSESDMQLVVPYNGTLKNLFIRVTSDALGGDTLTFTVRKNGANTAINAVLAPGPVPPLTISDTTNSASVVQGDLINLQLLRTGGAGGYSVGISCLGIEIDPA